MHILRCMGSKLCVKFEISHEILNSYIAKYAFYKVLKIWRLMISSSYDILSLSETGPWFLISAVSIRDSESLGVTLIDSGHRQNPEAYRNLIQRSCEKAHKDIICLPCVDVEYRMESRDASEDRKKTFIWITTC